MSLILDSFATEQDARRLAPSGHNANMLELRPTCENCNRPLPPNAAGPPSTALAINWL
jgi:hypothetical protein